MRRASFIFIFWLLVMNLTGCAALHKFTKSSVEIEKNAEVLPLPRYCGPKARIAVADFEIKAAKATNEIGSGLREMLVALLVNSNRFSVIERQELSTSAVSSGANEAEKDKIKTADLIITATLTEFEPQSSGGSSGIGGGGGVNSGALGGLLGVSLQKVHMTLDIRIVDASSSSVLASTLVQGQATDTSTANIDGFAGNWNLGAGLSGYANTPMEKAIRVCIIEVARYITQTISADYYKY